MGIPLHETEKNFLRFGVVHANHLKDSGIVSDTSIANLVTGDNAGLQASIAAAPNVHETLHLSGQRQWAKTLEKLTQLKTGIGKPATIGVLVDTTAGGGDYPQTTLVSYKLTSVDVDGVESLASAEKQITTATDANNAHRIDFPAIPKVNGRVSYRLYRRRGSSAYAGYYPILSTNGANKDIAALEAGTFRDLGATAMVDVGTSLPPTTSIAGVGALSNTEIEAARVAGLFTTLRTGITNDDATLDATLDRGGQTTN